MQTDSIGARDDPDLYSYTYNDPLNRTDPSGQCSIGAARIAVVAASADGPLPVGEAIGVAVLVGSCAYRAYKAITASADVALPVPNTSEIQESEKSEAPAEESEGDSEEQDKQPGSRETARERRERQREERARERGGDPDYERGSPGDNQRQNRAFRDATRGLTEEEQELLHREISGEDLPYDEIRERADEMIKRR